MKEVKQKKPAPLFKLNPLDRVIAAVDPVRAARRVKARAYMGFTTTMSTEGGRRGGYKAGSRSRRGLSGWLRKLIGGDADADTLPDLPTIRESSRDMVRNAPIATGAVDTNTLHIVGRGLRVQSKINAKYLGLSDEQAREWQRQAEFEFNTWAGFNSDSTECDATRHNNFAGLQALAFRSVLESGDCLALLARPEPKPWDRLPYKTKIKLVEADRVCNEKRKPDQRLPNGNVLVAGVESDPDGAPVNYHVMRGHPGNWRLQQKNRIWDIVPAFGEESGRRNVLHLMTRLRPGQTRGVPYLAPVIEILKQLDRYTEAEIMAAVVSGMFAIFIKHSGDGLSPLDSAVEGMTPASDATDEKTTNWDGTITPGIAADLAPGESIESASVSRPNTAFDAFIMAVLRQVGTALNIPLEILIKHFQSSYSASKAAFVMALSFWRERRSWLAYSLCQPVYAAIIEEAVILGRLSAPGFIEDPFIRAAYCRAIWTGDGLGSIDPLKDANAAEKRMKTRITTLEDEILAYDGNDYEDKIDQAGREKQLTEQKGLIYLDDKAEAAPIDPDQGQDPDLQDNQERGSRV